MAAFLPIWSFWWRDTNSLTTLITLKLKPKTKKKITLFSTRCTCTVKFSCLIVRSTSKRRKCAQIIYAITFWTKWNLEKLLSTSYKQVFIQAFSVICLDLVLFWILGSSLPTISVSVRGTWLFISIWCSRMGNLRLRIESFMIIFLIKCRIDISKQSF